MIAHVQQCVSVMLTLHHSCGPDVFIGPDNAPALQAHACGSSRTLLPELLLGAGEERGRGVPVVCLYTSSFPVCVPVLAVDPGIVDVHVQDSMPACTAANASSV